jgi:hypothetical protein
MREPSADMVRLENKPIDGIDNQRNDANGIGQIFEPGPRIKHFNVRSLWRVGNTK